ncbi:WXG100 family type VII secretion target [Embleya scabrispora]|uniref:WXG100 family type VII secretion target n=1 Tax=Embleya scabrispora TaxID=159449 RepID=UPI000377B863|nr:hypothetical protein [Embleya scabrispora]MYS80215.1 hypothetical protein [Streptomyces sp. SID5474]
MSDPSRIYAILNPDLPRSVIPPGNGGGPVDHTKVESQQLRTSAKTLVTTGGEINTELPVPDALDTKAAFGGWQLVGPLNEGRWKDQTARLRRDLSEISDGLYTMADNYDHTEHAVTTSFAGGKVI